MKEQIILVAGRSSITTKTVTRAIANQLSHYKVMVVEKPETKDRCATIRVK